jgi:ribosomal protein L12E/L44/L45/RPP1/RPP2
MKKFLTLLFTLAVACSLSLPVFAAQDAAPAPDKKEKKQKKEKKSKKEKKEKKGDDTAK